MRRRRAVAIDVRPEARDVGDESGVAIGGLATTLSSLSLLASLALILAPVRTRGVLVELVNGLHVAADFADFLGHDEKRRILEGSVQFMFKKAVPPTDEDRARMDLEQQERIEEERWVRAVHTFGPSDHDDLTERLADDLAALEIYARRRGAKWFAAHRAVRVAEVALMALVYPDDADDAAAVERMDLAIDNVKDDTQLVLRLSDEVASLVLWCREGGGDPHTAADWIRTLLRDCRGAETAARVDVSALAERLQKHRGNATSGIVTKICAMIKLYGAKGEHHILKQVSEAQKRRKRKRARAFR